MRKVYSYITVCLIVLNISLITSCNHKETTDGLSNTSKDTNQYINAIVDKNTIYQIPSPVELYFQLKKNKAEFNLALLTPTNTASNHFTNFSKAVNFGIFASDLAYCTTNEKNKESLTYFAATKKLADELSLGKGFEEKVAKRVNENISNSDSIYQITKEAYWGACNYLQENDNANLLPYIVLGGWIESVYIATNSVEVYDAKNPILTNIADQQLLLENLLNFISSKSKNDKNIAEYVNKLARVSKAYDKLYDNAENVQITKAEFESIKKEIKIVRNDLISK